MKRMLSGMLALALLVGLCSFCTPAKAAQAFSGTNVAAAIALAKKLGPGKTVVTILPDTAERYFSTPLFDGE